MSDTDSSESSDSTINKPKGKTSRLRWDVLDLENKPSPVIAGESPTNITFQVSDVKPRDYYHGHPGYDPNTHEPTKLKPQEVLSHVLINSAEDCKEVVYSSIGDGPSNSGMSSIIPNSHGFVGAVLCAYNGHFHLEIRPDDVWLSITTQFSKFIRANEERFRDKFVAFNGKMELTVQASTLSREDLNYGLFAVELSHMLAESIVDPSLREWVLPQFSTTTPNDTIAGSMIMMSTLGNYFELRAVASCGIPSVTLHGAKRDWEKLLEKIGKLREFGLETTMWYHLLEPIMKRFVQAWDDPSGEWNKQFWGRVATTETPPGTCEYHLTGWLTAFIPFNDRGYWQLRTALPWLITAYKSPIQIEQDLMMKDNLDGDYSNLTRHEFMTKYNITAKSYPLSVPKTHTDSTHQLSVRYKGFGIEVLGTRYEAPQPRLYPILNMEDGKYIWRSLQLTIDGVWYPWHDKAEIPNSVCDVKVQFNEFGREFESVMVAGLIGFDIRQIPVAAETAEGTDSQAPGEVQILESSIKPQPGWWIYETKHPVEEVVEPHQLATEGRRRPRRQRKNRYMRWPILDPRKESV